MVNWLKKEINTMDKLFDFYIPISEKLAWSILDALVKSGEIPGSTRISSVDVIKKVLDDEFKTNKDIKIKEHRE